MGRRAVVGDGLAIERIAGADAAGIGWADGGAGRAALATAAGVNGRSVDGGFSMTEVASSGRGCLLGAGVVGVGLVVVPIAGAGWRAVEPADTPTALVGGRDAGFTAAFGAGGCGVADT